MRYHGTLYGHVDRSTFLPADAFLRLPADSVLRASIQVTAQFACDAHKALGVPVIDAPASTPSRSR